MASKRIPFYSDPEFLRKQSFFLGVSLIVMLINSSMVMFAAKSLTQLGTIAYATPLKIGTNFDVLDSKMELNFDVENILLKLFFGLTVALQVGALFSYRKRQAQVNLVTFSLIITIVHILILGFVYKRFSEVSFAAVTIDFYPLLMIISPILQFLALQGIKADINKLRQANRFWS